MSESPADDGLDWDGFVGQIVAANPDVKPEWDRPAKSLAEQLHTAHPDLFPERIAPMSDQSNTRPTLADMERGVGEIKLAEMRGERDAAREELRLLRESLESMVGRWENRGGADGYQWQVAADAVRNVLSPKPETVGALLTQLQNAAIDRDEPLDRKFLLETVGKLAKLLATP